jgi:hypothetical protein
LQSLLQVCERIPTIATQLKILSTVKATMLGSQGTRRSVVVVLRAQKTLVFIWRKLQTFILHYKQFALSMLLRVHLLGMRVRVFAH